MTLCLCAVVLVREAARPAGAVEVPGEVVVRGPGATRDHVRQQKLANRQHSHFSTLLLHRQRRLVHYILPVRPVLLDLVLSSVACYFHLPGNLNRRWAFLQNLILIKEYNHWLIFQPPTKIGNTSPHLVRCGETFCPSSVLVLWIAYLLQTKILLEQLTFSCFYQFLYLSDNSLVCCKWFQIVLKHTKCN